MSATPVVARPSATVVVAREAAAGPELLMVLRSANTAFGASYVFPGGVLEANDAAVDDRCDGVTGSDANRTLDTDQNGIAYYSAAIRELFEETGILLARSAAGAWPTTAGTVAQRGALNAGTLSWPDFLRESGLRLACDTLQYFAHWVTPRAFDPRFSTRFFVAAAPTHQTAEHCGGEVTDVRWVSASALLDEARVGRVKLPRPTQITLQQLAAQTNVEDLLGWAQRRAAGGIERVQPEVVTIAGERRVVLPGDPAYPVD
ncbi:MAG: hypothetical protein AAF417_02955 [Pseudomonadota bacterium]